MAFRWEPACLSDDPFAGDFGGSDDRILSDKIVTNRNGGECHTCAGPCAPGTRNRVRAEVYDGELHRFRWCQLCAFAMAVYDRRPSIGDRQFEIGEARRASRARGVPA